MDNNLIGALVVAAIIALSFWGMYRSWKRRSKTSQATGPSASTAVEATVSPAESSIFSVFYVATTPTEVPLQRLNLPGLGFRAKAKIQILSDVIEIAPAGEVPTRIAAASFLGIRSARVAIDRVVEKDGLTAIDWVATNTVTHERSLVTSYFRIPNIRLREGFEANLEAFGAAHIATVKEVAS